METNAVETFELVVKDLEVLDEDNREQVKNILEAKCGFSTTQATEIIESSSFTIARSNNQNELQDVCNAFDGTGAKALIVKKESPFKTFFNKYVNGIAHTLSQLAVEEVEELVNELMRARSEGKRIYVIGNGGSATTASHFATDLAKDRFGKKDYLFKIMSLNDNVGLLSACANDTGYENVFSSQLENLLDPGDLVIAISSSGKSPNIVKAIKYANEVGAVTVGISGFCGGGLKEHSQKSLHIPTKKGQYGYMEDVSLIINHIVSIYIYEQDSSQVNSK